MRSAFEIIPSLATGEDRVVIPADLAMCSSCANEIFDPDNDNPKCLWAIAAILSKSCGVKTHESSRWFGSCVAFICPW
jgi:hypothetical protein